MRYRFVDQVITESIDPPALTVAKTFPPGDDAFSGPAGPDRVPDSLLLELLAMTGGHLLYRHLGRTRLPLLLKVERVSFARAALAGERLTASARVEGVGPPDELATVAETTAEVASATGPVASGRLLYLCVNLPAGVGGYMEYDEA